MVVIGAGQAGLSAAIHARLSGHDVLVLERQGQAGGKAGRLLVDGYRLDLGPSIIILPRLYQAVFERAGRNMEDYLRFKRLDPITRVYFERESPIDLPADLEACIKVLKLIAPDDVEPFKVLMAKVGKVAKEVDASVFRRPYHQPWQLADPHLVKTALPFDFRKSYKQLVDGMFESRFLKGFFYGFPSYGGQSYESKSIGAFMIPYLMLTEGVFYPEGGVGAIPAAFERLARELGVEFRFDADVQKLESRDRRITAAVLRSGERIEAEIVICAADRYTAQSWMGEPCDLEPSYSYFTLHWGLRGRVDGLSHHTLVIPENYESGFSELYRNNSFPQAPIVYLNDVAEVDPSSSPEGSSNVFAVVTSPAKVKGIDWDRETAEYRRRTLAVLERAGIYISAHPMEFERVQTPETFESRDGSYRGSLYGPDERHRLWGLFPGRLTDDRYRNLFYAGGSVQPGAGLPMVTLSGQFAAELIK